MTFWRRLMDIVLSLLLLAVLWPLLIVCVGAILILDGRPVLYLSERMSAPDNHFTLWKFRTMTTVAVDSGVSGGDKSHRITRTGKVMRRLRLDEIPQLWNILKGDIGFVGPRPPRNRPI